MKKLLSFLIVIAVMLGTCIMGIGSAALAVETSPETDFIAFDGVIEEYIGPGGKVVVPSVIEGEPIIEIAAYAFANNSDIEEVWICEGIEVIGYRAFYQCPNLYKIELPYSVYEAGSQAFAHSALESITIPGQLEILEYGLCGGDPLSEVIFSYGVKEILTSSFGGGATPYDVVFPASVEVICGFSFAFPNGNGSRRMTICNPNCLTGVTVQGVKENLNHEWEAADNVCISYSYTDNDQRTVYICPEGSTVGKTCEKMQAYAETTRGSSCDVSNNMQVVQYKPQSYFDALPLNQKNAGITATRTDLTQMACAHTYDNDCDNNCNKCGKTRAVPEHRYNWVIDKESDCGSEGFKHEECSICHAKRNLKTKIPTTKKHSYTSRTTKAPTCTKSGTKTHICLDCGYSYSKTIPALGHNYNNGKITKKSTCKAAGVKTYTCLDCGITKTSPIAKLTTHSYSNACDKTCNVCKYERKVPAHKYSSKCDTKCNVCNASRSITHSYKATTTKATLTKNGKTVKKCSVCGKVASTTVIKRIKTVKLSGTSFTYNGKVKKPSVTVKDSAGKTVSKSNYTVTYAKDRKNVGTYKVTVKFKGNYSGTKTLSFKINPPKTTAKLTAGKKALTVKVTKKTTQVSGYQIQYSTSKSFKSAKTVILSKNTKTSATIKKLKAKTTYYVRVRTYKTVGKTKYYSAWSTVASKKTK